GWHDKLPEVRDMALQKNVGLLYGSNFSIGMNLFLRVVANAVREFDKFNEYDVFGYELHHNQKADSPSGTAITLSDTILDASTTKQTAVFEKLDRKIEPDELHFASIRAGRIPGTHLVGFDSEADTIELTHRVRNRSCFAVGALKAALWLHGKQGVYSFQDMMAEVLC
ncbi:MAG: 4-hydroxy-tetrahydrodipicolinate reductase, partial [Candidatus Cloacimonetes bacterium HGW-Cloacimonetes-1]